MGLVSSAGHGERVVYNTLEDLAVEVHLHAAAGPWALLPSYRMGRCSSPGTSKILGSCFCILGLTALTSSLLPALSMAPGGFPSQGGAGQQTGGRGGVSLWGVSWLAPQVPDWVE